MTQTQNPIRFDLLEVVSIGLKWWKKIALFAFIAALAMALYMFTQKNRYKSAAIIYPTSAYTNTRANMFRAEMQEPVDAMGLENEIDRIMTVGKSEPVLEALASKYNLAAFYNVAADSSGRNKLFKRFIREYKLTKGSNNEIEVSMESVDRNLAKNIVTDALVEIQNNMRSYYAKANGGMVKAMEQKMVMQDSVILNLTEKLVTMREKYGIYSILSPSRKVEGNIGVRNARGLEEIQNIEEIKDKYVMDRAKYESICNEFKTSQSNEIPFVHIVQAPSANVNKVGPFRSLNVLGTAFAAMFLGLVFAVMVEYIAGLKHLLKPYNA